MEEKGIEIQIKEKNEMINGLLFYVKDGIKITSKKSNYLILFDNMKSVVRLRTITRIIFLTEDHKKELEKEFAFENKDHELIVKKYQGNKSLVTPIPSRQYRDNSFFDDRRLENEKKLKEQEENARDLERISYIILIIIMIFLAGASDMNVFNPLQVVYAVVSILALIGYILTYFKKHSK
ncbi:MAG: hypothetical protein RR708_00025 [Bacilli bacterium]